MKEGTATAEAEEFRLIRTSPLPSLHDRENVWVYVVRNVSNHGYGEKCSEPLLRWKMMPKGMPQRDRLGEPWRA